MIKRIAKLLITLWFLPVWMLLRWIRALAGKNTYVVLYFHAVTDSDRDAFARKMDTLLRHAHPVSLGQAGKVTGHEVSVTFDDGYACLIPNAFPALRARRIPATVFIQTGYFGRRPLWIAEEEHPLLIHEVMTEEDIRSNCDGLISFGSHTVNHLDCSELESDQLEGELRDSKSQIECLVGREVSCLSWPFGSFDSSALMRSFQAGYKTVVAVVPIHLFEPSSGLIGRVSVEPSDWKIEFVLKVMGAYSWRGLLPGSRIPGTENPCKRRRM